MGDTIIIETPVATVLEVSGKQGPQGVPGATGATGATGPQGPAGTGIETLTTKGDLLSRSDSAAIRVGIGSTGQVLKVSAQGLPTWGNESGAVTSVNGQTGAVTVADATHAVQHEAGNEDELQARAALVATDVSALSGVYFWDGTTTGGRPNFFKTGTRKNTKIVWNSGPAQWNLIRNNVVEAVGVDGSDIVPWDNSWEEFVTPTSVTVTQLPLETMVQKLAETGAAATATTSEDGLMSSADKTKLNGIAANATANTASSSTPSALGTAAAGSATDYARADHVHAAEVSDSAFRVTGSTDATKKVAIEVDTNVPANTTVTLTAPSSGGTIARTSDIPSTFAASAITSGVLDNARINFAAPSSIGSTTASSGAFTTLSASSTVSGTGFSNYLASPPAIGGTAANSGAFTTLNANNGTLTASAPVLDLSQTWNNAAVAFTGIRLNVTKTASANTSDLVNLQIGGVTQFRIRDNQLFLDQFTLSGLYSPAPTYIGSTGALMCATQFAVGNNLDTILIRDGASGTLAQRNGTNAQTFRLYNTFTDASNYERGFMRWSSNVLQIGTEAGGTGSARNLELQTGGVTRIAIAANGDTQINGFTTFNQNVSIVTGRVLGVNQINLNNTSTALLALGTDSTIRWGSSSATAPLLKRSSTTLQVRLADDSAYSVLDAQLRSQGTAPATSGATGTAGDIRYDADYIYVCTAANTWKRAAIATW